MVEEKESSNPADAASVKLDEAVLIDMINEVSDTMLLVFVGFCLFYLFIYSYIATIRNGSSKHG